jgi:hypothetical protein
VRAHAELRHVGLADRNRAGAPQPLDEQRVLERHLAGEDRRSARERKADRGLEILEGDRQAMQRAHFFPARDAAIRLVGQRQAPLVVQLRDDGVERRVEPVDLMEVRGHHFARRHLPRADQRRQFTRAREEIDGGTDSLRHAADLLVGRHGH